MNFTDWIVSRFDRSKGGRLPPRKADVARALGLRAPAISAWCRGASVPDSRHLDGLATALGLTDAEKAEMLAALAIGPAKGAA